MRVLTIEDDPTAQMVLKNILCKFADVTESANGEEGLQTFCAALKDGNGFDLVCLDIGLPDVQGNDLLRMLRKTEAENPAKPSVVLVMTASHEIQIVQKMITLGADGYFVKPVNRVKLVVRLRELGFAVRAGCATTA
jgi:two-component system chemotaxis response regulator CheY